MSIRPVLALLAVLASGLCGAALPAQPAGSPPQAGQEAQARIRPLMEALRIDALAELIQQEGLRYADELERDMFPERGGEEWRSMVRRIYDTGRMETIVADGLAAAMEPSQVPPLVEFFADDLGREIVELELGARRAMLDSDVEEASAGIVDQMRAQGDGRMELLEEFAAVNELVEMNVAGALNASYAFYSGLNTAGALDGARGEDEILREVWAQEPDIRDKTVTWLFSYLALAYEPLPDEDLRRYLDLSESGPGQRLNAGLFAAFDEMFRTISFELGLAAARFMAGEDL